MEGVQMSDNILTKSTDLGIGNVTVGNLVDLMRGTPPPTWEQTCLDLDKKLADSRQHVTELENRLRALWDKYDGDRKHYMDRIKRLEEALEGTVKWIVDLADSGDAGFWDVDEQPEIIAARDALKKECK
jgi:hypothetical protein